MIIIVIIIIIIITTCSVRWVNMLTDSDVPTTKCPFTEPLEMKNIDILRLSYNKTTTTTTTTMYTRVNLNIVLFWKKKRYKRKTCLPSYMILCFHVCKCPILPRSDAFDHGIVFVLVHMLHIAGSASVWGRRWLLSSCICDSIFHVMRFWNTYGFTKELRIWHFLTFAAHMFACFAMGHAGRQCHNVHGNGNQWVRWCIICIIRHRSYTKNKPPRTLNANGSVSQQKHVMSKPTCQQSHQKQKRLTNDKHHLSIFHMF